MPKNILSALEEATENLLYMSESDEAFEVVYWQEVRGDPSGETIRRLAGHDPKETVAEVPVDEFLRPLTEERKWHVGCPRFMNMRSAAGSSQRAERKSLSISV